MSQNDSDCSYLSPAEDKDCPSVDSVSEIACSMRSECQTNALHASILPNDSGPSVLQTSHGDVHADQLDEDDWNQVSYFNPETGTSVIKITAAMFKKSKTRLTQNTTTTNSNETTGVQKLNLLDDGVEQVTKGTSVATLPDFGKSTRIGCPSADLGNRSGGNSWCFPPNTVKWNDANDDLQETSFELTYADEDTAKNEDVHVSPLRKIRYNSQGLATSDSCSNMLDPEADASDVSIQYPVEQNNKNSFTVSSYEASRSSSGDDLRPHCLQSKSDGLNDASSDQTSEIHVVKPRQSAGPLRLTGVTKCTRQRNSSPGFSTDKTFHADSKNLSQKTEVNTFINIPSLNRAPLLRDTAQCRPSEWPRSLAAVDSVDSSLPRSTDTEKETGLKVNSLQEIGKDHVSLSTVEKPGCGRLEEEVQNFCSTVDPFSLTDTTQAVNEKKRSGQKQKKAQKNSGYFAASQIEGNVGDRPLDELLHFINGKALNHVDSSRKNSQKVKKKLPLVNDNDHSKARSNTIGGDVPQPLDCVNFSVNRMNDFADCVSKLRGSGKVPVACEVSDRLTTSEDPTSSILKDISIALDETSMNKDGVPSGFCEKKFVKTGSDDLDLNGAYEKAEDSVTDVEVMGIERASDNGDLISSSLSAASEYDETSEFEKNFSEQTDEFTVVQKKKRNKFGFSAKTKDTREIPVVDKRSNISALNGRWSSEQASSERSEFSSSSLYGLHQPWSDVFKDKNRRKSEVLIRSSGSENSSSCSAPVSKGVTSDFAQDQRNLKIQKAEVDEVVNEVHFGQRYLAETLQNDGVVCKRPVSEACGLNIDRPSVSEGRVQKPCAVSSEQTAKYTLRTEKSSSREAPSHPVVFFDTKKKKLVSTSSLKRIDISFGFDPDEVVESSSGGSSVATNGAIASISTDSRISHLPSSQFSERCTCVGCTNNVLSRNTSAPSLSNNLCHAMTPHPPNVHALVLLSPGSGYVAPVGLPVGIVPPTVMCDHRQVAADSDVVSENCEVGLLDGVSRRSADISVASEPSKIVSRHSSDVFSLTAAQAFLHSQFQKATSHSKQLDLNN